MANPVASIEIQARSAGLSAQLREARAKFGVFGDQVAQMFIEKANKAKGKKGELFGIGGKRGIGGSIGDMIGTAGGTLMAGGVSKVAGFVEGVGEQVMDFNDKMVRLQILAEASPAAMDQFGNSVRMASDATGKSRIEILDAASAYVALTGDMDTAAASVTDWTKVAQATNSSVSDIAGAAASLHTNLGVLAKDQMVVLGGLASQGKKGAIEMKDLAGQFANIAPLWSKFGDDDPAKKALKLGAALQVAKRGFGGDAGETVTGLQGMMAAFERRSAEFAKHNVKVFNPNGKGMRDVYDIIQQIQKSDLMAHPDQMIKTFGRIEGMRGGDELVKGIADMKDFANVTDGAAMITRDLGTYTESAAGRSAIAMNHLKNTIADAFTPERINRAIALMERFAQVAETGFKFLDFVVNGKSKDKGTNVGTSLLLDRQGEKGDANAIAHANKILSLTADDDRLSPEMQNEALRAEVAKAGGLENAKAGAKKYLESQSVKGGYVATSQDQYVATAQQGYYDQLKRQGMTGASDKEVANAIAKGFASVVNSIQISIDATSVHKAAKSAPVHRTGNTGR